MNWLDIVIVLVLLVSVVSAISKGFSREVLGLTSAVAALMLGIWFYGPAGAFLQPYVSSRSVANLCGFVIVFISVLLVGAVAGNLLSRLLRFAGLSWFDRLLGAGFGALRGLLIAVALILALMAFAPGPGGDKPPDSVVHSRLAPYVIDAAHAVAALAPQELKAGFRKRYEQVKGIWRDTASKGVRSLPVSEI